MRELESGRPIGSSCRWPHAGHNADRPHPSDRGRSIASHKTGRWRFPRNRDLCCCVPLRRTQSQPPKIPDEPAPRRRCPVEHDLTAIAAAHRLETFEEPARGQAVGDDLAHVKAAFQHRDHLVPGLEHLAAVDALRAVTTVNAKVARRRGRRQGGRAADESARLARPPQTVRLGPTSSSRSACGPTRRVPRRQADRRRSDTAGVQFAVQSARETARCDAHASPNDTIRRFSSSQSASRTQARLSLSVSRRPTSLSSGWSRKTSGSR